jgi:proprotein convertase subtilisin/kexin type 5
LTCFSNTDTSCYSCKTNRSFLVPNSCPCSIGFYEVLQICVPCSPNCKTCSLDPNNCTSCHIGSLLTANQCYCTAGYYQNGLICSACDPDCSTCTISAANCLSCNTTRFTVLTGSACMCPNGKFQNSTTLICDACSNTCLTCSSSSPTSCLTCDLTDRYFSGNQCLCNPGLYDSGVSTCSQCNSPCVNCNGPSLYNCTSCITGYILMGSICMPNIVCSNYFYDGFCVNTCPETTYPATNICLPCINGCLTCTSSTQCSLCISGRYFN